MEDAQIAAARKGLADLLKRESRRDWNERIASPLEEMPAIDDPCTQLAWLVAMYESLDPARRGRGPSPDLRALRALPSRLLARSTVYDQSDLARVVASAADARSDLPLGALLGAVERSVTGGVALPLGAALTKLRAERASRLFSNKELRREIERIDALLGASVEAAPDAGEAWSDRAIADLATLGAQERGGWTALFALASESSASKPTGAWSKRARERVDEIGEGGFSSRVVEWFALVQRPAEPRVIEGPFGATYGQFILERNEGLLRGLVWACATIGDPKIARALGDLAVVCFTKVPNIGAVSMKVGNACVYTLGALPGLEGVAQLGRLKTRVKYAVANRLIEKALDEAAKRTGLHKSDLEDIAVPTFGLTEPGAGRFPVGDYVAEMRIGGEDAVALTWRKGEGKAQASVPAELAREHASEVKALKKQAKDIASMLAAQRVRLERLLGERSWTVADARTRFLDHPLVAPIARRLIWHLRHGERTALALFRDGRFEDVRGRAIAWQTDATIAALWHPLGFAVKEVRAWRDRIEELAITQPFKQAHREIYVITDAELRTETYSNRFAAHILRQHPLAALCRARGWRYLLQGGGFDGANSPTIDLPSVGLRAEYWVETIQDDAEAASGISLHVATDQVRFARLDGTPVPLRDVPALVFSEVMRDVDLFVGVCSVGNDPAWRDGGRHEPHLDYWTRYAFGQLTETAHTRRAALERLIPRLKIADRCTLTDRFLVVRGELRTYKIHLGSANILMEPNDQYLCIVPSARDRASGRDLRVPFEGDNTLSVIVSKALLLAADTKIDDPSIRRQIARPAAVDARDAT